MKTGNYEKKPVKRQRNVADREKKVKNPLLQAYISSLLCLVLCVTMFMGSSFAWFTSEVNNTGNEIYIGTLDVDLQKFTGISALAVDEDGSDGWVSLKSSESAIVMMAAEDTSQTQTLFSSDIRWQPGYTAIENLRVKNLGDLDFQYRLQLIPNWEACTDKNGDRLSEQGVLDLAQYFTVSTKAGMFTLEGNSSYSETVTTENDWSEPICLKDIFENGVCIRLGTVKHSDENPDVFSIALHMSESAPINIAGQKLVLNVKLVAYQTSSESGAFEDEYDESAPVPVSSETELRAALSEPDQNIMLNGDITLTDNLIIRRNVSIDLNGYTLKCEVLDDDVITIESGADVTITGSGEFNTQVVIQGDLTICEGTYRSLTPNSTLFAVQSGGNLTITGGTFNFNPIYVASGYQIVYSETYKTWSVIEGVQTTN